MGKKRVSKYRAVRTERDGFKFDSKKEAAYYDSLCLRRRVGDVDFFLRQVPFHLPGNVRYVVDFMVLESDGSLHFIDVKGMETPEFKMKKKMVENHYGVEIEVVK